MFRYFAHAGETHETEIASAWHTIANEWYIALPLYVAALFALGAAVYLVSKSKTATLNVLLAVLFVAGVLLYATSPPVSIVSLAAGFGIALTLVMTNLAGPASGNSKKQRRR